MRILALLAVVATLYVVFSHGQFAGQARATAALGLANTGEALREAPATRDRLADKVATAMSREPAVPVSASVHTMKKVK